MKDFPMAPELFKMATGMEASDPLTRDDYALGEFMEGVCLEITWTPRKLIFLRAFKREAGHMGAVCVVNYAAPEGPEAALREARALVQDIRNNAE